MITAIITHFYQERLQNLVPIVTSLNEQKVDQIIIWNNDLPLPVDLVGWLTVVGNCEIKQSDVNLGCQGRFAAVPFAKGDLILFHDNDLITSGNAVQRLVESEARHAGDIHTATGERHLWNLEYTFVSRARFELVSRHTLSLLLRHWHNNKESEHDDLWLSTRALHAGLKIHEVNVRWRNLSDVREDIGFWKSMSKTQWEATRSRVFLELMRMK